MPATPWSYIIEALGGLALFILGMRTMSEGLQKVTGERLRRLLEKGTGNRLTAPLIGSCLASLLQSGSAASVLVVGLVNAGLLSLYQALGVLLGTGIGTTLAIQFIAFRVTALALPAITVGVVLSFFSRSRRLTDLGGLLLGAGLVFFGLSILEGACIPLSETAIFAGLKEELLSVRLMAVLFGALLTFVVQSGGASIGVVIALAAGGAVPYDAAVAMVIGEVAGAAIIPLIASIGGSQSAKRAVVLFLAINAAAIVLVLAFFPLFLKGVDFFSPGSLHHAAAAGQEGALAARPVIARHLANAHTLFTLGCAVLFLPLIGILARSAETLLPTRRSESEARPRFIDLRVLTTPTIALAQAWNELERMSGIANAMYQELVSQFEDYNPKLAGAIRDKEVVLDVLHRDLSHFLIALSRQTLSLERAVEIPSMLQLVNDIELVGDLCESLLNYLVRKKEDKLRYSGVAMDELKMVAAKVGEAMDLAHRVVKGDDPGDDLQRLKIQMATLESELHQSHLKRLKSGKCSIVAGLLFGDMIASFSKIAHLCYTIVSHKRGISHDPNGSRH